MGANISEERLTALRQFVAELRQSMLKRRRVCRAKLTQTAQTKSLYVWEYQGIKQEKAEALAKKVGLEVLGSGWYSLVIAHPDDPTKVIKIGWGPDGQGNYWTDSWLQYAALCMDLRADVGDHEYGTRFSFLPVVFDVVFDKSNFFAVMERLDVEWDTVINSNCHASIGIDTVGEYCAIAECFGWFTLGHADAWSRRRFLGERFVQVTSEVARYAKPNAYREAIELVLERPDCPLINDVHNHNVMVRRCPHSVDQVVLIDPSSRGMNARSNVQKLFANLGLYSGPITRRKKGNSNDRTTYSESGSYDLLGST